MLLVWQVRTEIESEETAVEGSESMWPIRVQAPEPPVEDNARFDVGLR